MQRGKMKNDSNKTAEILRTQQRSVGHNRAAQKSEAATLMSSGSSGSSRKRHSKAVGAPRQHVRREVRIGVRPPANHDGGGLNYKSTQVAYC